jgi:hypothetical protein
MADENIHDDIREMRGMLTTLVGKQSETATKIDAMNERLFNGGSGAIPQLWSKFGALGSTLAENERSASATTNELEKQISALKTDRRVDKAWLMGAAAVFTLGIKAGLTKLGIHF